MSNNFKCNCFMCTNNNNGGCNIINIKQVIEIDRYGKCKYMSTTQESEKRFNSNVAQTR